MMCGPILKLFCLYLKDIFNSVMIYPFQGVDTLKILENFWFEPSPWLVYYLAQPIPSCNYYIFSDIPFTFFWILTNVLFLVCFQSNLSLKSSPPLTITCLFSLAYTYL